MTKSLFSGSLFSGSLFSGSLFTGENLACRRGGRVLFENLTLAVPAGAAVMLTGANGCGKTTLLEIVAGLRPPQGGRVTHTAACTFLPAQDTDMHPLHTVAGHLRFWADLFRVADIAPALDAFGLTDLRDRRTAVLSQGQKRRLGLARMLLRPAPLWILDEPFNALDRAGCATLTGLIRGHCANGGAVVAASHGADITDAFWQKTAVGA